MGALLPIISYYRIIYLYAGSYILASVDAIVVFIDKNVSEAKVMAFKALIGVGLDI